MELLNIANKYYGKLSYESSLYYLLAIFYDS